MSTTSANIPMSSQYIPQGMGSQQVPPVDRQQQDFPVRTLKVFGGIQIGLGVVLGILSLIGVILYVIARNKYDNCLSNYLLDFYAFNDYDYDFWMCRRYDDGHALLGFDITCLICSGWRTGFMVCSIIGASVFVPTMFSLGVVGSVIRRNHGSKAVTLSAFMAVLSYAEVVVAIIAAALCCCCTSWRTSNQQGVVFMNATQPGVILPHTQIPMTTGHQVMIATGQTNNPVVQCYPRAQQYQVMTTTQPTVAQIQSFGGTQQEPNNTQVYDTNPPVYKE